MTNITREFLLRQDEVTGGYGLIEKITSDKKNAEKKITEKKIITPRGHWLVLPQKTLADHVAREYETLPIAKRFFAPLAMTIIDNVMAKRADHDFAFLSSLRHDTILFVDDNHQELMAYLTSTWQPLWHWAAQYFGTALPIVYDLQPPPLSPTISDKVQKNIAAWNDWLAGAVFYLSGLLQSPLIAMFTLQRDVPAETLFAYAFAEQEYQAKKWGIDAVAQAKKNATIAEINQTQAFIKLVR
ncbi:MAG: hypothetical protein QM529_02590 [Hydrotalea sp.]|nr:hypothetical protein [Hydrotalea sp.]